jgi:hypothetical protein
VAQRVPAEVQRALAAYPSIVRDRLYALRGLVLEEAEARGLMLTETLTWGAPTFRTVSRSGTPIRIGREKKTAGDYALFFKCRTAMVQELRSRFADELRFEGNRAIVFRVDEPFPEQQVRVSIGLALTYYRWLNR